MPYREKVIDEEIETLRLTCEDSYGDTNLMEFRALNRCQQPIWVALRYKSLEDEWKTFAWRKVEPGQMGFFPKTRNGVIYVHAKTARDATGYRVTWEGTDKYYTVEGEELGFIRNDDVRGRPFTGFNC